MSNATTTEPTRYFFTFARGEHLTAEDAAALSANEEDGPLDLPSITDLCATYSVRATLRDVAGFTRGSVEADGNYTLD